jgi:hypothetical protein
VGAGRDEESATAGQELLRQEDDRHDDENDQDPLHLLLLG